MIPPSPRLQHYLSRTLIVLLWCWSSYQVARRLSGNVFGNSLSGSVLRKSNASARIPLQPRPKRLNGTLYLCGWESGRIAQHLFDDFLPDGVPVHDAEVVTFRHDEHQSTPADVLVFGGGECGNEIHLHWLQKNFRGTILYVNGESYAGEGSTADDSYMISSQPTSLENKNIYVPYAAMALVGMVPPEVWPNLTHHRPRPRNTGEFFMVYATRNCIPYRNQVALALSQVGMIYHGHCRPGGGPQKNFTKLAPAHQGHSQWPNNYQLFSKFRFCLVMENGFYPGYVTEKVMYAFLGGCLPIWYGTTDVWKMFNRKSFLYVNVTDTDAIDELVRHVRYLNDNEAAYHAYFQHSILAHESVMEEYFSLDDDIGNGRIKHEIRVMMRLEDERYRQLPLNVKKEIAAVATSPPEQVQPEPDQTLKPESASNERIHHQESIQQQSEIIIQGETTQQRNDTIPQLDTAQPNGTHQAPVPQQQNLVKQDMVKRHHEVGQNVSNPILFNQTFSRQSNHSKRARRRP